RGWMVMPDGPFERIHAFVNGRESYTCDPEPRDDLGQAFPHIPNAGRAQFNFQIPRRLAPKGCVHLIGMRNGLPVGRMQFRFRNDLHRTAVLPPEHLMLRVVDTGDWRFFVANGYKSFGEMRAAISRHRPLATIQRLLDWGCGCGRLTAHWLRQRKVAEVYGCDIDSEAIDWCRSNLTGGRFAVLPVPP